MKLKAITLALFVAGLGASFAFADDGGHGKGKGNDTTATTTTDASTTTTSSADDRKVTVCHRAGRHGKYVKIRVSKSALKAKLKHGDVVPGADGKCPVPAPPAVTTAATTTTTTTTTAQ